MLTIFIRNTTPPPGPQKAMKSSLLPLFPPSTHPRVNLQFITTAPPKSHIHQLNPNVRPLEHLILSSYSIPSPHYPITSRHSDRLLFSPSAYPDVT